MEPGARKMKPVGEGGLDRRAGGDKDATEEERPLGEATSGGTGGVRNALERIRPALPFAILAGIAQFKKKLPAARKLGKPKPQAPWRVIPHCRKAECEGRDCLHSFQTVPN